MPRSLGRRLFTGVAAVAAAAALTTPVYAAGPGVHLVAQDVTVAAGGTVPVSPVLFADKETTFTDASVTFELSDGLKGVSVVAQDEFTGCVSDGPAKLTCTQEEVVIYPDGIIGNFTADVTATAAALGATGTITLTFEAKGVAPVSHKAELAVAEGVDLEAGPAKELTRAPGAAFDATLEVRNNTDAVVHGAAVVFDTDYAIHATKQFSNCFYADGYLNVCTFDEELEPGTGYQVVLPYQLSTDVRAPGAAYGSFGWQTAGDWDDFRKYAEDLGYTPGDPGKGGKLELRALPAVQSLAKQTDTNPDNNWQSLDITVTGKNGTDLVSDGSTVTGAAGDTVTVPVGVHNDGPATLDFSRVGEPAAVVVVTIPTGTKVATVPDGCMKAEDDAFRTKPGALQYVCFSGYLFPVNTKIEWKFGLKITDVIPNAEGVIETNPACQCQIFSDDTNKANNLAKIVVNPADEGGQGGGLPITGPGAGLLAGGGAALVAVGAFAFFLTRRSRSSFEA